MPGLPADGQSRGAALLEDPAPSSGRPIAITSIVQSRLVSIEFEEIVVSLTALSAT
jgi:hypothetical protein